jgi:hypothetical protein
VTASLAFYLRVDQVKRFFVLGVLDL